MLIVFALLLWVKASPVKKANRMLGLSFSLLAVLNAWMLFLYHAYNGEMDSLLSWYLPLDQVLIMFIGPVIYFYLLLLFDRSRIITPGQVFRHALPALPALVYVAYFATLPLPERLGMLLDASDPKRWMDDVLDYLFYIQLMPYLLFCFLKVRKQRKSNYLLKANGYQTDIRWLYYALGLALVGLACHLPLCIAKNCNEIEVVLGTVVITLLVSSIFLQSVFTTGLSMQNLVEILQETEHGMKMGDELVNNYLEQLQKEMETSKIYRNPACTLEAVSRHTHIPQHHLSYVVNRQSNKNFSDFINEYRCKHACTLLEDKYFQKMTLEAIGKQSGFGSRSNFCEAFKKFYGKTPSEYREELRRY
jgi:AraC-like DNA-binding protein